MGMGRFYEEFLGQPERFGKAEPQQVGYDLDVSKKRKIAMLKQLLGDDFDEVLKGVRISENKGDER